MPQVQHQTLLCWHIPSACRNKPLFFHSRRYSQIGHTVFVAVTQLRDILNEHCHIIASELPVILQHAEDCPNQGHCAKDWFGVWWNGMGWSLLDGHNQLSFGDAFSQFELLQFGEMAEGCKAAIMHLIKDGNGFHIADRYVLEVAETLAESLITEEADST
jgi:hypothetical protein